MAAPELRLKVTLDTSFLKGQISRLPLDFAGANVSIRPKFDRQTIANEFRLLNRYIGSKKFNITIASNLEAEIKNADRLVQALGRVQRAASGAKGGLPIGGRELSRTKSKGGFAAEEIKTLFGAAVQGGLIDEKTLGKTRDQMVTALGSIGRDSIAGLLNGLQSGNADLQKAAQMLGSNLISSFKGVLGIASPSREFKKIGEAAGQGFEQGLLSSMADAFDSLERQLGTKLQRLKAQAIAGTSGALAVSGRVSPVQVADVTPRDYARIAGSGPRAALPPGVDRSAETLQNFYRSLDQIGIALASTVDSAERAADAFKTLRNAIDSLINRAKVLTGEQSLQARLRPSSVPGGMPLLTGRAPSRALPMLSAAAQRPERFTSQEKLFKDFLGRTIKAVVPEIGSAAIGRSLFGGTQFREIGNAMRRPQLGAGIDTKVETVAVKDLTIASRNIAAATNALKAQKLLPAAGGTSASQMIRQVLSGLPPLKAPQIGAQNISPRGSLGQFPMAGMMAPSSPLGSMGQFPVDPMLAVGGASAMGQKVAGPYPWSNTARSARGGYIHGIGSSLQFPMSGMMGPSSPLGRITPQSSMFAGGGGGGPGGGGPGGGGLGGGGGSFGGMRFNVPQLPGAGVVREIGTEFAFAAKQVLLFGTAYKALAFLQGFPGQVGNAVGALQSFRNTLGAISPSAAEAAASSQFILDVVDKYNTPIQSARDGFTKLYASMKPTGFSGDEIRNLFLGISQAAATFGMSAEKVDRVNYAFAQMASKGQVMSEELKGQLGDVLPGAMGIFAEAAGFKGPEAITKFSKALEDGAYKGAAMKTLLTNVGSIMRKEFGPGAEGAARTFQGVINRMQNSLTLLYESFEPVAVGFLNSVVMPLTRGVKTITDGFNAFFAGTQAKTAGGMVFAQELERLRPAFDGIRANVAALMPVLQSFGKTLLEIGKIALQIAGNPLVGYLGRLYLIVLPINMAMGILRGLWASNALQLVIFNARVATGTGTLAAFRGMTAATGATSTVAAGQVRGFGLALRAALATTVVGLAVVGLGMIAEAFMTAGAKAEAARQKMSQFMDSVKQLGKVGDVVGATTAAATEKASAIRIKQAEALLTEIKAGKKTVSEAQMKELRALGLASNMLFVQEQGQKGLTVQGMLGAVDANIKAAQQGYLETQTRIVQATQAVTEAKKNQAKEEASLQNIDLSAGDGTGKKPKEQSLESYYSLQDTLAKNAADFAAAQTEEEFRHKIELLEMYYDIQETRANAYQKDAIRFEREMVMIEARRQEARLKAQLDVQRAQASVAGGAGGGGGGAGGGGKGLGAGIAQYITGDPSSPFYRADHGGGNYHEHLAFVSRQAAEEAYKKLTSAGIQVTEFKGKSRVGRHTPGSAHYEGLAFDVPGAQVPVGRERELTARVQSTLGIGGARPAPVPASRKRDAVAEQNTIQASIAKTAKERMADAKAVQEQIVALEKYRDSAFPTVEQETQNKLLAKRNELFRSGMTDEQIDREIKLYENQERGTAALAAVQRLYDGNIIKLDKYNELMAIFNRDIATQNTLLQQNATLMAQAKFDQTIKGIRDQVAMARSITPDQEMRTQIAQEDYVGDQAESVFQERKTLQGAQKLKEDMQGIASSIGNSFGEAFKGIITGSMTAQEALAGMFQSIADHFADMVAQMIAEWIKMMILKGIEAIINPMAGLGNLGGGISSGLSSGFSAGAASAVPTDAAGWGASFGTSLKFANGGIAPGGFTAFANGGMVTGPTMGLVGEGRYNEAIVPLPDGKSIPVELAGGGSSSPTVIVNVDAKGSQVEGNEQNANQLGRVISAAVQTELIKQQRPGGLLAR